MDAPNQMDPEGDGVDIYELQQLFGRVQVVDLRSQPRDEPIPKQRLESEGIEPGHIVLLLVGYSPPKTPDDSGHPSSGASGECPPCNFDIAGAYQAVPGAGSDTCRCSSVG